MLPARARARARAHTHTHTHTQLIFGTTFILDGLCYVLAHFRGFFFLSIIQLVTCNPSYISHHMYLLYDGLR